MAAALALRKKLTVSVLDALARSPAARPVALRSVTSQATLPIATQWGALRQNNCDKTSSLFAYPPHAPQHLYSQQWRSKNKRAKIIKHAKTLERIAREPAREAAKERRQKEKEKKAARKAKQKGGGAAAAEAEESEDSGSSDGDPVEEEAGDEEEDEEEEEEEEEGALPDIEKIQSKMDKVLDRFENALKQIRGGEPTLEMFDPVHVDAYGAEAPLKSVAQVVIVSPTLAHATCFDPALAPRVCKAISATLLLNAQVIDDDGGNVVKIPLPRVTMETRQEAAKLLGKRTEAYKAILRKVRRKAMGPVKQGVAGRLEHVSKDDAFELQQQIDKQTDAAIHKLGTLAQAKHDSIMAV